MLDSITLKSKSSDRKILQKMLENYLILNGGKTTGETSLESLEKTSYVTSAWSSNSGVSALSELSTGVI